jgi:capsular polysaccharide transport system permease protein
MDALTYRDAADTDTKARDTSQASGLRFDAVVRLLKARRGLLLFVIAPTLLVAAYTFGIAAKQYESEAHFIVKTVQSGSGGGSASSLAQMFGLGAGMNPSQAESLSVGDFLSSHDAVDALKQRIDLIGVFRRPQADPLSRLASAHPAAETLLKYYRKQIKVAYSSDTGITTLTVRTFVPQDAKAIANILLGLGEQRVNDLNQRALANTLAAAETQLHTAEEGVAAAQGSLTHLRQGQHDIDPERTSTVQISLVAGLQSELAQERAQLAGMGGTISADSPQHIALAARIRALETQVASQSGKLTGSTSAIAPNLGAYEALKIKQDFAAKRYESAAAALESAREQALKQELYIVRIVEPNLPQKSLYPQRWLRVGTVFFILLLSYGIGWLILAGVREHAM